MILILVSGFLLVLGISLMVLDDALKQAGEGYEDSTGFHQKRSALTADSIAGEEEISIWDKVEGACCPLDINPSLGSMGNHPLSPQRPWKTPN